MFLIGFLDGSVSKEPACSAGDPVKSLGQEDPVEKEMATHSGILTWKIPWTEEPGGLQSIGLRVGHDLATKPPPPDFIEGSGLKEREFI